MCVCVCVCVCVCCVCACEHERVHSRIFVICVYNMGEGAMFDDTFAYQECELNCLMFV